MIMLSTPPRGQYLQPPTDEPRVPNNQRSTHEQPPPDVCRRNGPGPPGGPDGLDAP